MHTFFINTSKRTLSSYDILFDVYRENKRFVSMDCPMSGWYDEDRGYMASVREMGEMIDGYLEMNNAFHLILYVDLPENEAYAAIKRDAFHDKERDACCRAMRMLYTHVVSESVVAALSDCGRSPQGVLLMFGEEKKFTDFFTAANDAGKDQVREKLMAYLGLPSVDVVADIAKKVVAGKASNKVAVMAEQLQEACVQPLIPGIRGQYQRELLALCEELINEADPQGAYEKLFERICTLYRTEVARMGIHSVSCPYDCYACRVNKSTLALSQLNIALYVLQCVEAESFFENAAEGQNVLPFRACTVEEIAPILQKRKLRYEQQLDQIETLAESYAKLKLAPTLSAFDHKKFGLDAYGQKARSLVLENAPRQKEEEKQDAEDMQVQPVTIPASTKVFTLEEVAGEPLIAQDEKEGFDYYCDHDGEALLDKKAPPEAYIARAKEVRAHHLSYLDRLHTSLSEMLSHYAGKSRQNKPAILQMGAYRYAKTEEESKTLENVERVSAKAYETVLTQYMAFCAGRSVAITDIEEQCNRLVSRVDQIRQSLKKLKAVALGLLVALVVLYLPFVVIQFEAITRSTLTLAYALASLAVPMALLYLVFAVLSALQKRKLRKVWLEFKKESDTVLEENATAAKEYYQLLFTVVPALRWVYEYKLDVGYYAECCDVAEAKIDHHRHKLHERILAIGNILSDLEYRLSETEATAQDQEDCKDAIDYNLPFCTGKKNRSFYCVISGRMPQTEERGQGA